MHVAFVSQYDAHDVRAWSGTPYYMAQGLAEHVERVSIVSPLSGGRDLSGKLRVLRARLGGRTYLRQHTRKVVRAYADEVQRRLEVLRPDAVLSAGSLPLSLLEVDCPTASWSDATFESNLYFYADYAALPDDFVVEAHRLERAALERCRFAFYTSDYAARSALHYYGADPKKVVVIPYGANLDREPPAHEVEAAIAARPTNRCDLLFLGTDWVRKGGDVAVKVAEALHRRGVAVTLRVVGAELPLERLRPFVHPLGFISKATDEGRARLRHLLSSAHFLVLPSRADCTPMVFAEANAYGVPVLTAAVGGIPSVVRDGVNGRLFPPRPNPAEIAEAVAALLERPGAYRDLAQSSRTEYEQRLNWRTATAAVARHLAEAVAAEAVA